MKKAWIVVVGSSNTDMVVKVPHIPVPGETILGSEFMVIPGGKGANQAVAAARAGAGVRFIACVADDAFGLQAVDNYNKEGIDTRFIKIVRGTHSGVALINVATDGENSIAVAPGANSRLLSEDIVGFREAFIDAAYILVQLEIPLDTVTAVAQTAEELGIPLILNPAPGIRLPDALLGKVSIITPNETEAALLTGRHLFEEQDIPIMARELYEKGAKIVIITLGKKGVYLKTADMEGYVPGYLVKANDTTAAGDVFSGSLASALSGHICLREAVDFAQKAAAISVTRMGAQPSAPRLSEIIEFVAVH